MIDSLKIGLFGIGLDAYWPQFEHLKERLQSYLARVGAKVARPGVEVVNLGLNDTPDAAMEAGHRFRQTDVDLILLHVTTYALSSTVLPVVRRAGAGVDPEPPARAGDRLRMVQPARRPVPHDRRVAGLLLGLPFARTGQRLPPRTHRDEVVLIGHDGPGHIKIAEGKTKVRPRRVYHGKVGRGLSVEMMVKHGPVTLLSVVETADRRVDLLTAEGESVPGPILEIGNTNSRYRFAIGPRRFVEEWSQHGPAHHCAVGVGQLAGKLDKLGRILGLRTVRVC